MMRFERDVGMEIGSSLSFSLSILLWIVRGENGEKEEATWASEIKYDDVAIARAAAGRSYEDREMDLSVDERKRNE